jgi:hypothetical protein
MAEQQIQVNIDYLRKQRIHICMPCYGGQLTESTFMSYIKWGNTCRQLGIDWTIETMTNESLISRARNTLVAKFLNTENSTHLVFIDADIGWEPWHLLLLINHDVDVIGGLYPMKSLPVRWVVNGVENGAVSDDGNVVEVSKTGTGFMVVKRHVFDKLQQHPAVVPFKNDIGLPQELDPHMRTYYDTDVREGRYYSEDWTFCENWRDLGGKVWVDKRVLLRHTGTYTFDYQTQQPLYEALKREIEANAVPPAPEPEIVADSTADLSHLPPERQSAKVLAKTKTVPKEEPATSAETVAP